MRFFVRDLRDFNVLRNILRKLMFFEKSLLDLYTITEKFRRTKLKYAKLQKKALKTQELKFYKKLIQRNMLT